MKHSRRRAFRLTHTSPPTTQPQQAAMKNLQPVKLYGLQFFYNISQVALCSYMCIEAAIQAYRNVRPSSSFFSPPSIHPPIHLNTTGLHLPPLRALQRHQTRHWQPPLALLRLQGTRPSLLPSTRPSSKRAIHTQPQPIHSSTHPPTHPKRSLTSPTPSSSSWARSGTSSPSSTSTTTSPSSSSTGSTSTPATTVRSPTHPPTHPTPLAEIVPPFRLLPFRAHHLHKSNHPLLLQSQPTHPTHPPLPGDIYLTVILNGAIHTVMYTYYFLSMHTKDIWWKKYLTLFQIIQFLAMNAQVRYSSTHPPTHPPTPLFDSLHHGLPTHPLIHSPLCFSPSWPTHPPTYPLSLSRPSTSSAWAARPSPPRSPSCTWATSSPSSSSSSTSSSRATAAATLSPTGGSPRRHKHLKKREMKSGGKTAVCMCVCGDDTWRRPRGWPRDESHTHRSSRVGTSAEGFTHTHTGRQTHVSLY